MDEQKGWSEMPYDVMNLIASRLAIAEAGRASMVCKWWRSILGRIFSQSRSLPILLHTRPTESGNKREGNCRLFSPWNNRIYKVQVGRTFEGEIQYSNYGWVLVFNPENQVYLVNPMTSRRIDLPDHIPFTQQRFCFSCSPENTSELVVYYIYTTDLIYMQFWRYGDEDWTLHHIVDNRDAENQFIATNGGLAYHKGLFYVLGEGGKLGAFDWKRNGWRVYKNLQLPKSLEGRQKYGYMVEFGGKLYSIFTGYFEDTLVDVFQLENKKRWRKLKDLRNKTLFISPIQAIMIKSQQHKTNKLDVPNKIYSAMIHKESDAIPALWSCSNGHLLFKPKESFLTEHFGNGEPNLHQTDRARQNQACKCSCTHNNECVRYSFATRSYSPMPQFFSEEQQNSVWILPSS